MAITASVPTRRRLGRASASPWQHIDGVFVVVLVALSILSVVAVLAATHGPRTTTDDTFFMVRQGFYMVLGWGVLAAVASIDYRKIGEWWGILYGAAVASLIMVMLFGSQARGAQRGFELGGLQVQPSEFVKLAVIVALAGYLTADPEDRTWKRTLSALGLVAVPVLFIVTQPDLGTAMVFGAVTLAVLLAAGVPGKQMLVMLALAVVGGTLLVTSPVLEEYQRDRLMVFVNPEASDIAERYNVEQSQIAIANGGVTGEGLLQGGQTANGYVPAQETDFIFTAVAEELGFLGASALLLLYGALLWRMLRAAQLSRDLYGTLVCVGVFAVVLFQIFENVGMTMGIMPVTGIALPFMSYGGSSVLMTFAMAGLVVNVHMRRFS